jgi:hypothetical protein
MKKFFALILLIGLLAGCASGLDENLAGVWNWESDGAYVYMFHSDGTGERGFPETLDAFTWETRGSRLSISRERALRGEIRDESWTFEINEHGLTLTNSNRTPEDEEIQFTYLREITENNPALAGTWSWDFEGGEAFTYVFNEDGTGTRGFPNEGDSFTWTANDSRLNILRDKAQRDEFRGEFWSLELDDGKLVITSLQIEEYSFAYNKVNGGY